MPKHRGGMYSAIAPLASPHIFSARCTKSASETVLL